jgi:hypothetical protein
MKFENMVDRIHEKHLRRRKEYNKKYGSVKCDCGHYMKYHHAREGWCDECGCTWYYPNHRYILRKKKEKQEKKI